MDNELPDLMEEGLVMFEAEIDARIEKILEANGEL